MLNVLIADDNLYFVKNFINYVISQTNSIRITNVATDGQEVIEILQKGKIDLLLLDLKMPKMNGIEIIDEIMNFKLKKIPNIIVISGDDKLMNEIRFNPIISDILHKGENIVTIYNKIAKIERQKEQEINNIEAKTMSELLYIGFNPKHKGTQYLKEAIIYIYKTQEDCLDNLEKRVYSVIAHMHNRTNQNIKSNIIKATDYMYVETRADIIKEYFMTNMERKPTPKVIISMVLNKMKENA